MNTLIYIHVYIIQISLIVGCMAKSYLGVALWEDSDKHRKTPKWLDEMINSVIYAKEKSRHSKIKDMSFLSSMLFHFERSSQSCREMNPTST